MNTITAAAGFVTVDDVAIWGTGETAIGAEADMKAGFDLANVAVVEEFTCDANGDHDNQVLRSAFRTVPATAALISQVAATGGCIAWGDVGGIACTMAEENEA